MPKKIIIGLTGGVQTGKSTVAKMFKTLGAEVIDADKIAHSAIHIGKPGYAKIVKLFGTEILNVTGEISRKKLSERIFCDEPECVVLRKKVENIVHPIVWKEITDILRASLSAQADGESRSIFVIEVPLLFEVGWNKKMDLNVVVVASQSQQSKRSKNRYKNRIDKQMPLKEKMKKADIIIDNSGSLAATKRQVEKLFGQIIDKIGK